MELVVAFGRVLEPGILLATSLDAVKLKKRGFKTRVDDEVTWRAISADPYEYRIRRLQHSASCELAVWRVLSHEAAHAGGSCRLYEGWAAADVMPVLACHRPAPAEAITLLDVTGASSLDVWSQVDTGSQT